MKIESFVILEREDIQQAIPYAIIAETIGGSRWNTGKCKRLKKEFFTREEIANLPRIHKYARDWYLIKGVPDNIRLRPDTIKLFIKLGEFCSQL